MEPQILLFFNGFFDNIETSFLITSHIASNSSLNVPSGLLVDGFLGHGERIVDYSLLKRHTEKEFTNTVDVSTVVGVLDDGFASFEAVSETVTESMDHQDILDSVSSLLFLDCTPVSFVSDDSALKKLFEVIGLSLLLPE